MSPSKKAPRHQTMDLDELAAGQLKAMRGQRVLVLGDLMLDHYIWGSVDRITAEAPVQILKKDRETHVLGGASNVAHNIQTLGGEAVLMGVIGSDDAGRQFQDCLAETGISSKSLVVLPDRPTTIKTRVVSMGQQLLRIDAEDTTPISGKVFQKLVSTFRREVKNCKAVILSDYAKGVLTRELIGELTPIAREAGVPVLVDPKGQAYEKYRGVDILTPNQKEASLASGVDIHNEDDLREAGRILMRTCKLQALLVTRSAEGVAVIRPRRPVLSLPAKAREVFDVAGAGDSFIAGLAMGIASGLSIADAAALANHCGGIVVAKLGVATVSPDELLAAIRGGVLSNKVRQLEELQLVVSNLQARGRQIVFTNGCFDLLHPGHIRFLHEARSQGDLLVVGLNTDASVRALKGANRPILKADERAAILSALEVVDYIIFFDELTPENILRALRPNILVKGQNIAPDQVVGREIVESYGGKVHRLPVLEDDTAMDLVDSIRGEAARQKA
ncbi:MAG: D-glycero-beta-D-manno-heptose-7-phosphate kinase [Candidatus Sumerlaeia bacterium]